MSDFETTPGHYLAFDTETNGLPAGGDDVYCVQLGWEIWTWEGEKLGSDCYLIKPEGWIIPDNLTAIHGISTAMCRKEGRHMKDVLDVFLQDLAAYTNVVSVGHNVKFDIAVISKEIERHGLTAPDVWGTTYLCTMQSSTDLCQLQNKVGRRKAPKLTELYQFLFNAPMENAHKADADIAATMKCFWELMRRGYI